MTRMQLNPARAGTIRLLASPQRVHAAVMAAFPSHDGQPSRPLWRLDQTARHDVSLLLVSAERPDLTHVIEQAGWPARPDATWQTREYQPFLDRLAAGQTWAFRLRANPVVRRRDEHGRIKVSAHVTVEDQLQWMLERAEQIGVAFPQLMPAEADDSAKPTSSVEVSHQSSENFERRAAPENQGRSVTIATARYDGLLTVIDAAQLRGALIQGVGRAKAYGCGLLTLAPVRP